MDSSEPVRILIVEDDGDTASLMTKLLEKRFAASIDVVSDCASAKEALAGGSYDVVTLDFILPDGDGLELLSKIAVSGGAPRAILVTGHGDEEIASRALRLGASGYVMKNENLSIALPEAVEKALDRISLERMNDALEFERQQLLSIFESIGEPIYVSDPETYEILYSNQVVRDEFGEVYGKKCYEELQGLERPCPFCTNHLIFGDRAGTPYIWEFQNKRNNHWYRCIDKAVRWPDGRMVRSEIAVDITDQKLAEERIRFQAYLLHTVEQAVVATDLDGRIIFWNRHAEKMFGIAADETLGQSVFDLLPSGALEENGSDIISHIRAGESWRGEMPAGNHEGVEFCAMVHASPIHDENGTVSGIVAIVSDESERKHAEEALRGIVRETNERREEITALLESTRYVLEHKDFRDAARAVYELCKRLLGAGAGFVLLFGDEGGRAGVLLEDPGDFRGEIDAVALAAMPVPTRALDSRRALFDNDFRASVAAAALPDGHLPVDNILCAPLVIDEELAGLMAFANKRDGFTRRDELMASAFSEIYALALRGGRALEMLENSEARFRYVAETASEAIICGDIDYRITYWNHGAERIFGYPADEMLGESIDILVPVELRSSNREILERAIERGDVRGAGRTYEETALRKDGSEFPVELSLSTWTLAGESYFTVIVRDITTRRQSGEALRDSEERYRRLVEAAPDIIYTISMDGTITSLNPAFEKITGWSVDDWLGKPFAGIVHPDDIERAVETYEKAAGGGVPPSYELRILTKSGRYVCGEFLSSPHVVKGEVVGEFGIARDIEDRKSAEAAVRDAEAKYRGIFMNSTEGIFQSTRGGRLLTANPAFARMLGYGSAEEMTSEVTDVISLYVRADDRGELTRLLDLEKAVTGFEAELRRKDGSTVIASINAREVHDSEGFLLYYEGSAVDITERNKIEERLRHTDEMYRALMRASPDSITVTDLEGRVTSASQRTAELHGIVDVDAVIGMSAFEFIAPEERERAGKELEKTLLEGANRGLEYEMLKSDGSRFTGALDTALIRDANGDPAAFIATVRDVTESKHTREQLARANVELDAYAQVVSHDLRGPLSNIALSATTLLELLSSAGPGASSAEIREVAGIIESSAGRARELIDNILALAEAGQKPSLPTPVEISSVVAGVIAEAATEIDTRGIRVELDDDLGVVRGDATQLYQLFSNLIWNAIMHNDSTEPMIKVSLHSSFDGVHRYLVRDNGSGIPPENLEKIFLPYFSSRKGEPGIGLLTVQKIISLYGGSITAYNDGGACFEFEIHDLSGRQD